MVVSYTEILVSELFWNWNCKQVSSFEGNLKTLQLTNTASSMRFTQDCSKAKITNLDFPLVPIDKNVVTLEVPMDNRRVMAVEI